MNAATRHAPDRLPVSDVDLRLLRVLGGVVWAVVISVLAGMYPAVRAARLEPLETLRLG